MATANKNGEGNSNGHNDGNNNIYRTEKTNSMVSLRQKDMRKDCVVATPTAIASKPMDQFG